MRAEFDRFVIAITRDVIEGGDDRQFGLLGGDGFFLASRKGQPQAPRSQNARRSPNAQ